jgi:hypothetical protein
MEVSGKPDPFYFVAIPFFSGVSFSKFLPRFFKEQIQLVLYRVEKWPIISLPAFALPGKQSGLPRS